MTRSLSAHGDHSPSTLHPNETEIDQTHSYHEIQLQALSKFVKSANPMVAIVDTRMPQHDDGKRIPGAKAIPTNATIENITANLPDKEAMIIVYCSNSQCPSSSLFADRLTRMGYRNVWKYAGGIEEWEASGQKVEMGKPAVQAAAEKGPKSA